MALSGVVNSFRAMDENRKVAVVTGGAVRVGRALSLGLAREGFDVMAHYHGSVDAAGTLVDEVAELGRTCVTVQADLSDPEGAQRVADATLDAFGSVDLLVNSASIFHEQPLFEADVEEWDRVMAVNLRAPFLLTKALETALRTSKGSVVNIVDVSAFEPWIRYPHHAVSKAGLLQLTRVMARVLGPDVRANAIAPGTVLPPPGSSEAENERERQKALVKRLGSPDDVLEALLFLVRSNFVTGEVIVVDGGLRWNG